METKSGQRNPVVELIKAMKDCGAGNFMPPIDGVTYGFEIEHQGKKCSIFDTVEDDDYREESCNTVEEAIDGFMIDNRPLSTFAGKIRVKPCLVL